MSNTSQTKNQPNWAIAILTRIAKSFVAFGRALINARRLQANNYIMHLSSIQYVREYAHRVEKTDPRLAADLRAAADRAENMKSLKDEY